MPTLMQKIRLAIRGWNRRREENEQEVLKQNVWGGGRAPSPVHIGQPGAAVLHMHIDSLTVAYLDGSEQVHVYLDVRKQEVIDTVAELHGDTDRRHLSRD